MEALLEIIFEILFELLMEGSLEVLGTRKKIALPLRILAFVLFFGIACVIFVGFLLIAISIMEEGHVVLGWLCVAFGIFLLGCLLYAVRKKLKQKQEDRLL